VASGTSPPGTRPPPESLTRAGVSFFFGESNGTTFASLRALYGLGNAEYLRSMATGFEVFASNSKSRQFFCFTGDRRFIIKTMSSEELRALSAVLGPYTQHLGQNPRSLIVHYCGHYHVRLYKYATDEWEDVHFLVMRNLMADPRPGLAVRELYDVKGSTVGRAASEKDKAKETKVRGLGGKGGLGGEGEKGRGVVVVWWMDGWMETLCKGVRPQSSPPSPSTHRS
jgi:hypothetical protein